MKTKSDYHILGVETKGNVIIKNKNHCHIWCNFLYVSLDDDICTLYKVKLKSNMKTLNRLRCNACKERNIINEEI